MPVAFLALGVTPIFGATITFVPSETTVLPGTSFTLQVYGTSALSSFSGFSLYLDSSTSGLTASDIEIESPSSINTADFTYGGAGPTYPEIITTAAPVTYTGQSSDLGGFTNDDSLPGSVQYLLSTETISVASSTPLGSYTIGNAGDTVFTDPTFTEEDTAAAGSFSINVVPEPSTLDLLFCAGALAFLWNMYRRLSGFSWHIGRRALPV